MDFTSPDAMHDAAVETATQPSSVKQRHEAAAAMALLAIDLRLRELTETVNKLAAAMYCDHGNAGFCGFCMRDALIASGAGR